MYNDAPSIYSNTNIITLQLLFRATAVAERTEYSYFHTAVPGTTVSINTNNTLYHMMCTGAWKFNFNGWYAD